MLPTFKQIHPPKSLPVTAAIEKWKETTLPTFQQPLLLETLYLKKKEKIDSLHLESESAVPQVSRLRPGILRANAAAEG
jgi:hypothetical protein